MPRDVKPRDEIERAEFELAPQEKHVYQPWNRICRTFERLLPLRRGSLKIEFKCLEKIFNGLKFY